MLKFHDTGLLPRTGAIAARHTHAMRGGYSIGGKTGQRGSGPGEGTQKLSRALARDAAAMELVMAARRIIRVQAPIPLGEVTVVPAALSGRAEAEAAHAIAAAAAEYEVPSAADVLRRLRLLRRAMPVAATGGFAAERGRGIG
jgi:hypothetical protein